MYRRHQGSNTINRDPRRTQYYCTIVTFKTFSGYACTFTPIPHSLWSRRMKKKRYTCLFSPGWLNGSKLTKPEVNCSQFLCD